MDAASRVLAAFPWARFLPPEDQARFGEELAHHPRELSNSGLESLILQWKLKAARNEREVRRKRAA